MHTATACAHRHPKYYVFCSWYYRSVSAAVPHSVTRLAPRVVSPMPLSKLPYTFPDHFWVCSCYFLQILPSTAGLM